MKIHAQLLGSNVLLPRRDWDLLLGLARSNFVRRSVLHDDPAWPIWLASTPVISTVCSVSTEGS